MQFISELEDAADVCRLETRPLTREDAIRVAAGRDEGQAAGREGHDGGVPSGEAGVFGVNQGVIKEQRGGDGGPVASGGYQRSLEGTEKTDHWLQGYSWRPG